LERGISLQLTATGYESGQVRVVAIWRVGNQAEGTVTTEIARDFGASPYLLLPRRTLEQAKNLRRMAANRSIASAVIVPKTSASAIAWKAFPQAVNDERAAGAAKIQDAVWPIAPGFYLWWL